MTAIAPSLPICSQPGAMAVERMSAPSWNSSEIARQREPHLGVVIGLPPRAERARKLHDGGEYADKNHRRAGCLHDEPQPLHRVDDARFNQPAFGAADETARVSFREKKDYRQQQQVQTLLSTPTK